MADIHSEGCIAAQMSSAKLTPRVRITRWRARRIPLFVRALSPWFRGLAEYTRRSSMKIR
jgi:hypothetical protein